MHQPVGYVHPHFPNHVCKLHKALYGLKQAPRAWCHRLQEHLLSNGFVNSSSDSSLFIYRQGADTLFLLVYVDDILITSSSSTAIAHLITNLSSVFAVKDLGRINYFLGIKAIYVDDGLILSQSQYIYNLLQRTNMINAKPISSPMSSTQKLSLLSGAPHSDPTHYRSVVGALQYLSLTRPDISFAVNKVCQFMHKPTEEHWSAVKRILRYLKFSINFGLLLRPSSSTQLSIYSDADWAGCPDDPNPVFHARTKHVEIDYHFVRKKVQQKTLEVRFISSKDQLADGLTKPIVSTRFNFLRDKLNVQDCPLCLKGHIKKTTVNDHDSND
ncbi:hypothetical protein F2P56_020175 [Juglans regia]|uniref:Reverse transcriptase Ty1/copia-type domain-containing protein n=1 Tax=Juglans regia TaxID=51240 RepID=A0A833U258_JUGRE|nr:hypothetical protein F2P56_020175 [Juglans regia]